MPKFRKRPVVVEAHLFGGGDAWPDWLRAAWDDKRVFTKPTPDSLYIHTLEGEMEAKNGDWIIRGVKGEIYPCKPDIFAATYEPA